MYSCRHHVGYTLETPLTLMSHPDAGFDRVAAFYDPLSRLVYGKALLRAQQHALVVGLPPGAPHVLVIGGGTGWVVLELLRLRPAATILFLEASAQMLAGAQTQLLRHHPAAASQVEFRLGTEASLSGHDRFDAVVTFFFLDLFEPPRLRKLVARLDTVRNPHAPWLLADFAPPQTWWQRSLLAAMYRFFRLTTGIRGQKLPPIREELARLGLRAEEPKRFFGEMVEAAVWRLQ
jgi:tRNA (cmo5U34)-methyltransferase